MDEAWYLPKGIICFSSWKSVLMSVFAALVMMTIIQAAVGTKDLLDAVDICNGIKEAMERTGSTSTLICTMNWTLPIIGFVVAVLAFLAFVGLLIPRMAMLIYIAPIVTVLNICYYLYLITKGFSHGFGTHTALVYPSLVMTYSWLLFYMIKGFLAVNKFVAQRAKSSASLEMRYSTFVAPVNKYEPPKV